MAQATLDFSDKESALVHRLRILHISVFKDRRSRGGAPTDAPPMRSIFGWAIMVAWAALACPSLALAQSVNETNSAPVTLSGNYTVATTGVTTFQKTSPGGLEFTGTISGGGSGATLFLNTSAADSLTTFTFSGSNSFAGQITLNRGSLAVNNLSALGNPANVVYLNSYVNNTVGNLRFNLSGTFANPINNADVVFDNTIGVGANNVTLTGSIYGGGGLTKYGVGTLTITGSNTYANGTTISAGTLQVGNGGAMGSLGSGAVSNSGALVFNRSGSLTVAGAISGTGSLTQAGPGTTVLTGGNTYSGTTTISSGTLQVGNGGSGSALSGTAAITNNASLVFNIGDSQTLSRPVAGTGDFTKAGAGTLTLSGTNSYAGSTTISGGELSVAGGANLGAGPVRFTAPSSFTVTSTAATFGNAFDLGSVSGTVTLTVPNTSSSVINGAISGGIAGTTLFFTNATPSNGGMLTLNGSNSFQGSLVVYRGPLILGNASAAGASTIKLNANSNPAGDLQFTTGFTIANNVELVNGGVTNWIGVPTGQTNGIAGVISGNGFTKIGAGTLVLAADNSYSGGTTFTSGTIQVGNGGAAGSLGSGAVANGGALVFNRSGSVTVAGAISGTGSLTQAGSGATVLTGGNTYSGATTISSGTLQVGNGGSGSTLGGTGTITNNGALVFTIGDSQTISRSITGSGNLVKSGAGTLTLAGNNSYAGGTTISGGTLTVAGTSSIGPGQVRFTGPSTLTVTSTAVTFPNAFDLGSVSGTVTLMVSTTSSTVINGPISGGGPNTTLFFDNPVGGANTGVLTLNGSNSFQGSLMVYRGPLILGNASAAGASTLQLFANNNPAGDLQFTTGFTIANNVELLNGGVGNWIGVPSGQTNGISGVISGNGFTKIGAGTLVLAADNSYSGGTTFTSGTIQVGSGGAAGSLGGGAVANGGALVFNRSGSVTVPGVISGTGSLTQAGPGATVLTGGNTYTGATTISSGTLQVGSGGSGSTLGGTGTITNNGALVFTIGDSQTISRSITGSGNLVKSGAGTLTLAGNNSYAGGTTISGGTLTVAGTSSIGPGQVRFTGPSTLNVTSSTVTFPNAFDLGSVSGTVTLMVSTTSSTVINGPITGGGPNTTLFFDNPIGGANTGVLTLNGTNSFQGSLMVYRGPLILGNAAAAGASTLKLFANNNPAGDLQFGAGGFTIPNDVELQLGGVSNWIGVPTGQTNGISGVISGNGFTKIGAGTLVLEADNSYSGGTAFTSGTIQVGNGGAAGSLGSGPVSNGGALVFNRSGSLAVSAAISGTGSVTTAGPGTIVLSGSNSFSGGTVLSAGVLNLGSANAIGSTGTVSFGGGTLQYSASNTTDYSGRFSTAAGQQYAIDTNGQNVSLGSALTSSGGSLTKTGLGTLILGGTNTYSGGTVVSAGRLVGTADSLQGVITNDAAVEFSQVSSGTYSGVMAGSGAFVKTGSGLLALTGNNSYSGTTTIAAGRLVGSTASLPGTIANASQLEFAQASAGTFASAITGTGSLTKTGAGNLILSGSSNYSGATSVAAGRLSVNGSLGNSAIAVLAAAELGGSGSIAGPVSIAGGGSLSPGNSIASLATGTTTFASGATFEYEVDSTDLNALTTAADLLVVNGDLNLDSGNGTLLTFLDLATTPNPFVADTTIFALINYSGAWNGGLFTYNGSVLPDGGQFKVGSQQWEIDYNRTSSVGLVNFTGDYVGSNFVAITAVPEPGTFVLLGIGLAGLLLARRRG